MNYILIFNLAKRLTEKQKEELKENFTKGKTVDALSHKFNCTKLTIVRNLKKIIGEAKYTELVNSNKTDPKVESNKITISNKAEDSTTNLNISSANSYKNETNEIKNEGDFAPSSSFLEIVPIDYDIENSTRKELSSIPISEIDLPDIVYMVVDKNVELEIKFLKDYPEWDFLPVDDLNRKTIEIFFDIKSAKRACSKTQKVIKVPNTNVFKIAAPLLVSKGISRIVSNDILIAL